MTSYKLATDTSSADPGAKLRLARDKLQKAESFRSQRALDKAEEICLGLIRHYPDYFGALHTLGLIYGEKGQGERAVSYLIRAAIQNPLSWATHTALAGEYLLLNSTEMAAQALSKALEISPNDPNVLITLGEIYQAEKNYDLARDTFRRAYMLAPEITGAALAFASACIELGDYQPAADALQKLVSRGEFSATLLHLLTQLPPGFVTLDELDLFKKITPGNDTNKLLFARSRALDRAGRHDEAWSTVVEANRQKASAVGQGILEEVEGAKALLAWLRGNPQIGKCSAPEDSSFPTSLFILGPSRSGKTTAENLLIAHSEVTRGYENPVLRDSIKQVYMDSGLLSWASIRHLPSSLYENVKKSYKKNLTYLPDTRKVLTNTAPGHIWDVLFINSVIPNSKFVFLTRDLDDLCIRIFMKSYNAGHFYSYDLKQLQNYVKLYYEMIDLIVDRMPTNTLLIDYSELVAHPAAVFRKLTEFSGLNVETPNLRTIGDDRNCSAPYKRQMEELIAR